MTIDSKTGSGETSFGRWLKEKREELGLSRSKLARQSGVSIAQIWNIENGRTKNPMACTRERLERVLMEESPVGPQCKVFEMPLKPPEPPQSEDGGLTCIFCKRPLSEVRAIAWLTDDCDPAACNFCVDTLNSIFAHADRRDRYDGKARLRLVPKVTTTPAQQADCGEDGRS